jgi:glucosyl-3-phosphoglycerate synthase
VTVDLNTDLASTRHFPMIDDWPASRVAAAKGDCRVAVVLPARNEQATVGQIVSSIVRDHVEVGQPLVDDIIVVDSCSSDRTSVVAAEAGARVVTSLRPGKGEAMWHGLAATSADLVAYIDADLEQFDPRFVPALLGPLLTAPDVCLVKGAYERPVDAGTAAGGGRVTELMARPVIDAFWPELADVVQPLSGEYAARRSLLERLPFRCGYGVDIGLLLDALRVAGRDAIDQVDLGIRHHRHSGLQDLGLMAAEILHTVVDRLATDKAIVFPELATSLLQPSRTATGIDWRSRKVDVAERPPLDSLELTRRSG